MPGDASNTVASRACKLPRLDYPVGSSALQLLAAKRLAAKRRAGIGLFVGAAGVACGLYETGDAPADQLASAAGGAGGAGGASEDGASGSVPTAVPSSNVAQDVLGSDLLCKVMGFLSQNQVFLVIAVCHRWRQLAAGLEERVRFYTLAASLACASVSAALCARR